MISNMRSSFSYVTEDANSETTYSAPSRTIVYPDESAMDRMRLIEASGALRFWEDESEDVYDEQDGDDV